ncbi:Na+/H+ antiporter NhaA [Salinispora arenicola]|uniref:Na+/H+ antiporter NhaA n=1 Tax=Salinispora arenicola TaxID=168697 RepID=UPI0003604E44|nr:Na+/H+ antiporter NhaA [Salinispora arenicola]
MDATRRDLPPGSVVRRRAGRIADVLRAETTGGALLLAGAVIALIWANSPGAAGYDAMRSFTIGPTWLHLDLSLAAWAKDGLLAVFFFVAGLELKREFVTGELRQPRRAAVPIAAAVGGVLAPAAVYVLITAAAGADALRGWAIPAATDIAFALAVLAVIGRHLPPAVRVFLLTLAVVDDLIAIMIIAVFYTASLSVTPLLATALPLVAFAILLRRRVTSVWLLLPLALTAWALVHASGVHATVAGVLLALVVPARPLHEHTAAPSLLERFEHAIKPVSVGLAVPVFALMSAGVAIGGLGGLVSALTDPVAVGVIAGLVIGKPLGVIAVTWLITRLTRTGLGNNLTWTHITGLSMLAGIGFTVSLLIGELSFAAGTERHDHVKIAIVAGSLIAAVLAAVILRLPHRAGPRGNDAIARDPDQARAGAATPRTAPGHSTPAATGANQPARSPAP